MGKRKNKKGEGRRPRMSGDYLSLITFLPSLSHSPLFKREETGEEGVKSLTGVVGGGTENPRLTEGKLRTK